MIVIRNWLQEFIDISHISTKDICNALNSIGLEVDGVEKCFIPNGVVVGRIISCQKHPKADKLNICQVDIGTASTIQIVCGASNVTKNQFVPVATVGTNLSDNFIIKKTKIREIDSYGMICSSAEIGLSELNDGILELDDSIGDLIIGKELNEYPILSFETIQIELTANRGDCLSINGIARELSAYFNIPFHKQEYNIKSNNLAIGQILDVKCDSKLDSNFIFRASDIENLKLPLLYKLRMALVGIKKNTDIETAVAYSTHATGVLLNVYTRAIVNNNEQNDIVSLSIKKDNNGFDTVNGKVLLSTVGIETGCIVKEDNKIIIEASYTNSKFLSQRVFDTKRQTGDIYYRASRGSEPDLQLGMDYLTGLLSSCGSLIYNGSEQYVEDLEEKILLVNLSKINAIIGEEIPKDRIVSILIGLKFKVKDNKDNLISIIVPPFRHDIENIADVAEEIVRIIGIDNIKAKPLAISETNRTNKISNQLKLINEIRNNAIANGFFETITYIFSQRDILEKYNFEVVDANKDILNPIVKELNTFRTTLELNLIQAVSNNIKLGYKSIALFESGIVFDKSRKEHKSLTFVFSGAKEYESIMNAGKPEAIDFFGFSQKIANIIGDFKLESMDNILNDFIHPYQNANIFIDKKNIGNIYKLHPNIARDFDIFDDTFIATIKFDMLKNNLVQVVDISKYQMSKRDLSIVVPKNISYKEIRETIDLLNIEEIKQYNLIDIYTDKTLENSESLTIRFVLQSNYKTLQEDDINKIINRIVDSLKEKLNLILR
jgi:phenylalanyl-tRNA synthetase beta chain